MYLLLRAGLSTLVRHGPRVFLIQVFRWARTWWGTPGDAGTVLFHLDFDFDQPFVVGRGNVLYLSGWCFHTRAALRRLSLSVDGRSYRISDHGLPRPDVVHETTAAGYPSAYSATSGFRVQIPFAEITAPQEVELRLQGSTQDGMSFDLPAGPLRLHPLHRAPRAPQSTASTRPLIAIAMTTYNPDPRHFAEQVESLLRQTYQEWVCIVSDDSSRPDLYAAIQKIAARDRRFQVYRNERNLGFYSNYERCLGLVPPSATFVALADQDDVWFPDKLETCLAAFTPETTLVYGDMQIVDGAGTLLSPTYWTTRENNYTNLTTLLLANTVTGAASLFRSELLEYILPFPQRMTGHYHDHWIASVAIAMGELAYVDRALHAYRQHDDNVIGHYTTEPHRLLPALRTLGRWAVLPRSQKASFDSAAWQLAKQMHWLVRIVHWAQILLVRLPKVSAPKARALEQLASLGRSRRRLWHVALGQIRHGRSNLGLHWYIVVAAMADRMVRGFARRHPATVFRRLEPTARALDTGVPDVIRVAEANVRFVYEKIAPLELRISPGHVRHVNLLTSTIDFTYFFGGYIAVLNLARRLAEHGHRVRLVLTDQCDVNLPRWRKELRKYPGLEDCLDKIRVAYVYDRSVGLDVHLDDRFIASSWWTAHIAHAATRELRQERFVYLTQDFEPVFYPHGTFYALALESYSLPHYALFSTQFLQEYSRQKRLGVFARDIAAGEKESTFFQNAITAEAPALEDISGRRRKRMLFYARPDQHAERNIFVLGAVALTEAIRDGGFDLSEWEFLGIGATGGSGSLPLANGATLTIASKVSLREYYDLLKGCDLGLALMLTPHPSLVPLDMSAAGLVTVTNTYDTKTAPHLEAISSNLIAAEPTIQGIKNALVRAVGRVDDHEGRIAGTKLNWATSWEEAFNPAVMDKLGEWLC